MTTAWSILAEGTMKAAVKIMVEKNIEIDAEVLCKNLKAVIYNSIPEIQKEWNDALEAGMSELWLRELMNAQAIQLAIKAINL